jgi:hypothetical protein
MSARVGCHFRELLTALGSSVLWTLVGFGTDAKLSAAHQCHVELTGVLAEADFAVQLG